MARVQEQLHQGPKRPDGSARDSRKRELRTATLVVVVDDLVVRVERLGQRVVAGAHLVEQGFIDRNRSRDRQAIRSVIWDETACQRSHSGWLLVGIVSSLGRVVRRSEQRASWAFSDDESLWDSRVA
jgi:hypothetical protein